jgi:acetyl esterase
VTELHPHSEAALALWAEQAAVRTLDAEGIRQQRLLAREAGLGEPKEDVGSVEDLSAHGVPCRLLHPRAPDGAAGAVTPCLVYLHGGGFVFGDIESHDAQARRLANRTGRAVLAVDYRRPPEHVFPAALHDCETALVWLLEHGRDHGLDTTRTALVGDSAGANLALGTMLRRPGRVEASVLVYPFLDPTTSSPSYASTRGGLDRGDARWFWRQYVEPGAAPETWADPELAPLRSSSLGSLPRTLVQIAGADTLVDEDRALVHLARDQGAEVAEVTYDGMVHGFWRHPSLFDAAETALADAAAFLREGLVRGAGSP